MNNLLLFQGYIMKVSERYIYTSSVETCKEYLQKIWKRYLMQNQKKLKINESQDCLQIFQKDTSPQKWTYPNVSPISVLN